MKIEIIPLLKDNYAYLLEGEDFRAVVDPAEAQPVIRHLGERGLTHILNTHHHGDHTAGNPGLKEKYGCEIIGPAADAHRIPGMDRGVKEGDKILGARVIETPGHTSGHISFYFPQDKALFCGDTLFLMGCGRLFEGTPEQMWSSLEKIMALPDDAKIYCGHEYTLAGAKFCLSVEPGNEDLQKRLRDVRKRREAREPTVPGTLALEKKTNVFLRAGSAEKFAALREAKNNL